MRIGFEMKNKVYMLVLLFLFANSIIECNHKQQQIKVLVG